MNPKTLMGTDYKMHVELTMDDWAWLCYLLSETLKRPAHCQYCSDDVRDVLSVMESAEVVPA